MFPPAVEHSLSRCRCRGAGRERRSCRRWKPRPSFGRREPSRRSLSGRREEDGQGVQARRSAQREVHCDSRRRRGRGRHRHSQQRRDEDKRDDAESGSGVVHSTSSKRLAPNASAADERSARGDSRAATRLPATKGRRDRTDEATSTARTQTTSSGPSMSARTSVSPAGCIASATTAICCSSTCAITTASRRSCSRPTPTAFKAAEARQARERHQRRRQGDRADRRRTSTRRCRPAASRWSPIDSRCCRRPRCCRFRWPARRRFPKSSGCGTASSICGARRSTATSCCDRR